MRVQIGVGRDEKKRWKSVGWGLIKNCSLSSEGQEGKLKGERERENCVL